VDYFREPSLDEPTLATMLAKFHEFLADDSGTTIIEYGLIAAGIALAVIAAVYRIGPERRRDHLQARLQGSSRH
jgi:pilus assembly protein Flp/PilA